MPALVGVSRGKLILVNDDDLTYCSLRLDEESLATALSRIADIAEPLPRTLVWSAAWEMTRDAELKARDFVALVCAGVQAETEVGVAQRLLLQAQTALGSYAEPGWAREQGWPMFADRLLELARAAEPGSDHQLAYVNALCSSVLTLRHVEVLSALLDSSPDEQGPGRPGRRHRPALAHRDRAGQAPASSTPTGRRRRSSTPRCNATRPRPASGTRAAASAARPQLDVKEQAWTDVIEDDTLPNIMARAIIGGHRRAGTGRAVAAVHVSLLRGHPRRVGAAIQRGRADGGDRPVPLVGHQRRRDRRRRQVPRR